MNTLTAQQEKAIRAYNFSFTDQGVFNVDQLVAYFENEGNDMGAKTFLAAAYSFSCCKDSDTFDEENAEAHLDFLSEYGVTGFDQQEALKICNTIFELIKNGTIEQE